MLDDLPDELLLTLAHTYLHPRDILNLALTNRRLHLALLTHPGDLARARAMLGTLICVRRGWWRGAARALRYDGGNACEVPRSPTRPQRVSTLRTGSNSGEDMRTTTAMTTTATAALLTMAAKYETVDLPTRLDLGPDALAFTRALLAHPAIDPAVEGSQALESAAARGHVRLVRLLLEDGRVDPASWRCGALRCAVQNNHPDVVELLLQCPSRFNPVSPTACSAYVQAVECGAARVVQRLLGDERVARAAYAPRYLQRAARSSSKGVQTALLVHPAYDEKRVGKPRIILAAEWGNAAATAALLVDPDVDPAVDDGLALVQAARGGHVDVLALLLEQGGVDPRARNGLAFFYAVAGGHVPAVQRLLDDRRVARFARGVFVLAKSSSAMQTAVLAHPNQDPQQSNYTPLRLAAAWGNTDAVLALLRSPRLLERALPPMSASRVLKAAAQHPAVQAMLRADPRFSTPVALREG